MLVGISFSVIIEVEAESYTDNETISKNMDIKKDKAIEDKMFWCDEYDDDDGDNNDNVMMKILMIIIIIIYLRDW